MAPEFMASSQPTYEADCFYFGLVCIELFTGQIPDPALSDLVAIDNRCRGSTPAKPDMMSERVWSLAKSRLTLETPTDGQYRK
ncbi:hypothetical protein QCA50_016325 [Cerrena zonata]|uniref:Serine-threonine/tyrosine-protein kinase catalytic domain-containing protein n=1 Tax=Cerrena zonata TaxID=2478898 RepID=A0AAW0FQP1_9APHY